MNRLWVLPDVASAARAVLARLVDLADEARAQRGRFALAVSGGQTPEPLFRALASRGTGEDAWSGWHIFWSDERAVPPTDPRSNFGEAGRLWLGPAAVPDGQVHPIRTDGPGIDAMARTYEAELREFFPGPPGAATFDAVLLGVGPDGHTASLFPGSPTLEAGGRWVVAEPRPAVPPLVPRVSLTLDAIGRARVVLFLVGGTAKREVLARVFADPNRGGPRAALPAARVQALDAVEWYVDRGAAPPGPAGVAPTRR